MTGLPPEQISCGCKAVVGHIRALCPRRLCPRSGEDHSRLIRKSTRNIACLTGDRYIRSPYPVNGNWPPETLCTCRPSGVIQCCRWPGFRPSYCEQHSHEVRRGVQHRLGLLPVDTRVLCQIALQRCAAFQFKEQRGHRYRRTTVTDDNRRTGRATNRATSLFAAGHADRRCDETHGQPRDGLREAATFRLGPSKT